MTRLLDEALEAVRRMPAADQDAIADAMLSLAGIGDLADLPAEDLSDVLEGLAEIERGEVASDAEIAAAFRRFER